MFGWETNPQVIKISFLEGVPAKNKSISNRSELIDFKIFWGGHALDSPVLAELSHLQWLLQTLRLLCQKSGHGPAASILTFILIPFHLFQVDFSMHILEIQKIESSKPLLVSFGVAQNKKKVHVIKKN